MSDGNLIPISDEQAKAARELIDAGKALGGYVAGVLGDVPKDLFGLLIGDKIKTIRAERLAKMWKKAQQRLHDAGIEAPAAPNLKLVLPMLMGAADESSDELQERWANLLASSMDPEKMKHVRQDFSECLSKMMPVDARVLYYIAGNSGRFQNTERTQTAARIGISLDSFLVSFEKLTALGLTGDYNGVTSGLLPFGREFLLVVSD